MHEECLKVVSHPRNLLVCRLYCEQHILDRHHAPLRNGTHAYRYLPAEIIDDVMPASAVEDCFAAKVFRQNFLGFIDHVMGDAATEMTLEDVLETEEDDLGVQPAAALEVGFQMGQAWRVLLVMGYLVGVSTQEKVVLHFSAGLTV